METIENLWKSMKIIRTRRRGARGLWRPAAELLWISVCGARLHDSAETRMVVSAAHRASGAGNERAGMRASKGALGGILWGWYLESVI